MSSAESKEADDSDIDLVDKEENTGGIESVSDVEINPVILEIELDPTPEYDGKVLFTRLRKFLDNEKIYSPNYLELKIIKLCTEYRRYNAEREENNQKPIDISYLEHSHYLFSFRDADLTQEERKRYEARKEQLLPEDAPSENIYMFIKELLKVLSQLMVKWNIFDINHYGYRHKGRSLTVKLLDMVEINSQCLIADIFWFTFAIKHKPFVNEFPKILENYGNVLQFQINKIFNNLTAFAAIIGNCYIDQRSLNFELIPRWKRCFGRKNLKEEESFYKNLKGVELAYRYFEKNLIQEFLKIA